MKVKKLECLTSQSHFKQVSSDLNHFFKNSSSWPVLHKQISFELKCSIFTSFKISSSENTHKIQLENVL